jgi:hypothetical protein
MRAYSLPLNSTLQLGNKSDLDDHAEINEIIDALWVRCRSIEQL